jgi:hypothetical protein
MIDITKQACELFIEALIPRIGVPVFLSSYHDQIEGEHIAIVDSQTSTDIEGEDGQPIVVTKSIDVKFVTERDTQEVEKFASILLGNFRASKAQIQDAVNALEFPFNQLNVLRVMAPASESEPQFENNIVTLVHTVQVMCVTLQIEEDTEA